MWAGKTMWRSGIFEFCTRDFCAVRSNLLRSKALGFRFAGEISLGGAKPSHFARATRRNAWQFVPHRDARRCKTRGILHIVDGILPEVCNCSKFSPRGFEQ
jgi:hypothetical protein